MEDSEQKQLAESEADDAPHSMKDQERLASRSSRVPAASVRRQRMQPVLILSVVVLVVLLIVVSLTPLRDVVLSHFQAATPTATMLPGEDLFYIGFPWGSVSIDGRPMTHLPLSGKDPPLRLSVGLHRIVWQDRPFAPISCTVSVPSPPAGDVCPNVEESTVRVAPGQSARSLIFNVSFALLPASQRAALLAQMQAALDTLSSTDIVQPGDLYVQNQPDGLVGVGSIVKASQPLQATLHFVLDSDPNSQRACGESVDDCSQSGIDCHLICSTPATGGNSWQGVAIAYASWSYRVLSGKLLAHDQPDATSATFGTEHSVIFFLGWDGQHWHARVWSTEIYTPKQNVYDTTNPTCAQMMSTINGATQYGFAQAPPKEQMNWSFFAGPKSADGCLGVAVPQPGTTTSSSQLPVAYCLYHFGVLLAASTAAHRYWPSWPVADSYEQGLVEQIATRYRGNIQQISATP